MYNLKVKGKRELKLQGSSKIGGHCVAFIRAHKYSSSGHVEAEICDHHLHEAQLAHTHFPETTRQMIAAKLHDGVAIQTILDSIRDNVHGSKIDRSTLVNLQDIHNVCHQHNIE